jgi:membrane fusion protein (multidrug efflux system)
VTAFLRRHRVPVVLLALGVLVTALVAYRIRKQQAAAVPRRPLEIVVGVVKPIRKDLDVKLAYTADVLPNQQVAIFSKVSGYIKRLGADLGDFVREGQLLVEVEAPELAAAVEQARAAVATAEANLKVAESNVESAKASAVNAEANLVKARTVATNDARNAARLEDLHARGLIASMDLDNAKTNAESSQASLAAAEAQLAAARSQVETQRSQVALARSNVDGARASLKITQTSLDNTRILAPFSGYISARNLYPGASVNSQQAGTSTQAVGILVLQDIATVKVQVEVQERDISRVRLGSVARVLVDAYPDRVFEARAARIVHALDPRTRTLGVEMVIPNPDALLKPGMYARVELVIDHHPSAVLVPGEAVSTEADTPVVYVVHGGVVGKRTIATGVGEGTLVEVTKGLAGDELVIVDGRELVRDGQRVHAEVKK